MKRRKNGMCGILTIHDVPPMADKTVDYFEGLSGSHPSLSLREPIQPLDHRLDVLLSQEFPHEVLCPIESTVVINQDKLTKFPLLDLLGSKSEGVDQFGDYLHQNFRQVWRKGNVLGIDLGINTKSAEEVIEGREKIDQCVVASTHFFDRLGELDVREICR